jgi:hypothetical protein
MSGRISAVSKSPFNHRILFVNKAAGEWSVNFMLRTPYHWGKFSGTHWIGGWMGPRAGMNAVKNRNLLWGSISYRDKRFVSAPRRPGWFWKLRTIHFNIIPNS